MDPSISRTMWRLLEPYHAVVYFSPEVAAAMKDAGLKGYWMGYFAGRAAPMGPVPAEVVAAVFYSFAPRMVARAIPDAWAFADREQLIHARLHAVDATLLRVLEGIEPTDEVASLARAATGGCDFAGHPVFAAHASQPWPEHPRAALWHAATLLREHRGDGHVAALASVGFDGCEAHVALAGTGAVPRETLQPNRGWTDEEWEAAAARLRERGWLDAEDALTQAGIEARAEVERLTDRMALGPWTTLGEQRAARLAALLRPITEQIVASGLIPYPNPMGVPRP